MIYFLITLTFNLSIQIIPITGFLNYFEDFNIYLSDDDALYSSCSSNVLLIFIIMFCIWFFTLINKCTMPHRNIETLISPITFFIKIFKKIDKKKDYK